MIYISEEDKKYVIENIEGAKELLDSGNLVALLRAVSDQIDYVGFDKDDNFTEEGYIVQAIYDRLYYNN